ncbi:S1C family serine protease [Terrimonas sp. NA20]|uniref:S1C family serine protease n=1 Tax=Terrimonas ginsenosidimutans TaxID=2908004 RepID=A0ABS9L0M4_9BACT|nr:S1C family serine protease [Terrimonas ginsenosidimutans]MCG2618110.1 S1C family serine protease [Terrimonas ginsenosidimutans]
MAHRFTIRLVVVLSLAFLMNKAEAQLLSPEQTYAANSPGVGMVQTVFSGTVYVNKVGMNESRFKQLVDSVKKLDTSGTMLSAEEKLDIVVKALYNSPFRYFSRTSEYYRQQHRINSSGTGFFVTGDGYFVTNCHIIDRDNAYIRRQFILSTFKDVTDANIRSLEKSWEMTLNEEQRGLLNNVYSVIYSQVSSMIIFDLKKDIFVHIRVNGRPEDFATRRLPAKVVVKGKAMPGKDVAVLKVDSVMQMPTLPVSADPMTRIGSQVLVMGYPEPVTSNTFLARETGIEPTLTTGVVSALKRSIGGWPVIQMDAVIAHGSSGSPVCDNKGEVIGLATFGSLEQKTGSLAAGFNFAIPVSVVKEFLDSAHVMPEMSRASKTYNEALALYFKGYYFKARQFFESASEINGSYPLLAYYISDSETRVKAGQDKESFSQQLVFRVLAFVIILGGLYVFYHWQRLKRKRFYRP